VAAAAVDDERGGFGAHDDRGELKLASRAALACGCGRTAEQGRNDLMLIQLRGW
jgi:hypothetical protein